MTLRRCLIHSLLLPALFVTVTNMFDALTRCNADDVTFELRTLMDLRQSQDLTGGEFPDDRLVPAVWRFTFDPNQPGVSSDPNTTSYHDVDATVTIGDQCISGFNQHVLVIADDAVDFGGGTVDVYRLNLDFNGLPTRPTLFGFPLNRVNFTIADFDHAMFSNTSLPASPGFASHANELLDWSFNLNGPGTINGHAPFLLSYQHSATTLAEHTRDHILYLGLNNGLSVSLTSVLGLAIELLADGNPANDDVAVNNLEALLHIINAQYGKKIAPADADYLLMLAKCVIHQVQREC